MPDFKSNTERDREFIWHPYTQAKTSAENIVVIRGEGAYLYDENNRYLDAISSWWVNLHGHAHPHIAKKIAEQAEELEQVIFAGFSHPKAISLAEKLLELLPFCNKVFYSDNGSTAVEAAIKMALQFWSNKNVPKKKIICFRDAYHGDTFGAMSVSARGIFTQPFQRLLFDVEFIETPVEGKEEESLSELKRVLNEDTAAFIFEPLVLGSAGMLMYNAEILDRIVELCRTNNTLIIADEVLTGFGRTGKMFACDYLKNKPDIICLSKGITGGFLPFAATLASAEIYSAFHSDEKSKMLFHGHSYTGNALGCAAALASLEVFEKEQTILKIEMISRFMKEAVSIFQANPKIENARCCGTILAVDFVNGEAGSYLHSLRDQLYDYFIENKIILRPLGNTVYILPPYCISEEELRLVVNCINDF